ncbi:cytochrome P450 71A4-like protein, partial [Tanacetum coccineum]
TKKNLPPSPWKLPLIGNLHQLRLSPHRSLLNLAKKHGPLMLVHAGNVPMLVASSAEVAQKILKTHDAVFCNRPILKIPNRIFYGSKDIAFSQYGEHWRQVKSIVMVRLLCTKRVQSFQQVREEETTIMINNIGDSRGTLINLSECFISLTNNIVSRVVLGKTYRHIRFKKLMEKFIDILGVMSVGSCIPSLSWVDRLSGLQRTTDEVAKEFDDFLEGVLQEHLNKRKGNVIVGGSDEVQDLLDILLDVQKENAGTVVIDNDTIKAVILLGFKKLLTGAYDNFSAGTDTISTNIEWTISELVRHPRVMIKLQQEVTEIANGRSMITEEDLDKMKYLKAVIKESLRLHIPLPLLIQRESTQDVKLMGYDIPAGTRVVINAWAVARDPSLWEEAEQFKPERFLNSPIDYKGFHYEFIPFGGGRRGCPGIQFSVAVIELAIANLVYKFDLALPNGKGVEELDMSESNGITTHRKIHLQLVATPRL